MQKLQQTIVLPNEACNIGGIHIPYLLRVRSPCQMSYVCHVIFSQLQLVDTIDILILQILKK